MNLCSNASSPPYRLKERTVEPTFVNFAKEPYKRDDILQKRPIIVMTCNCSCAAVGAAHDQEILKKFSKNSSLLLDILKKLSHHKEILVKFLYHKEIPEKFFVLCLGFRV